MTRDRKAYLAEYHRRNKERIAAQRREYYDAHRDECLRWHKEYRARNQAKIKARREAYKPRANELRKRKYWANRDVAIAASNAWRVANLPRAAATARSYAAKNREMVRKWARAWRANNAERFRLLQKRSQEKNREKIRERNRVRFCVVATARVALTKEERATIRALYKKRDAMSKQTGVEHHVDHIIPLSRGGKHHPSNLRVITASENLRKWANL